MKLRVFRGDGAFDRASKAKRPDQQICGTYLGPKPVYFLMPTSAPAEEIEGQAFKLRNGRDMSDGEHAFKAAYAREMQRRGVA